jgi:hypothetical protein
MRFTLDKGLPKWTCIKKGNKTKKNMQGCNARQCKRPLKRENREHHRKELCVLPSLLK